MESAGLAGLALNCPQCGQPLRYLYARTPHGQILAADASPTESTVYVYACPVHGRMCLGLFTELQRDH